MPLVVGSKSEHKLNAVKLSLEGFNDLKDTVIGVAADPNYERPNRDKSKPVIYVPDQPFEEETMEGARNRAAHALFLCPDAKAAIGIESGLFLVTGKYYDKAALVFLTKDGKSFEIYTDELEFPKEFVEKARAIGFDKTTVGKEMAHAGVVALHDDPHASLGTKKPRMVFISEGLSKLFADITQILSVQPSVETDLIIDNNIRTLVRDIESLTLKPEPAASSAAAASSSSFAPSLHPSHALDDKLRFLIKALQINCLKPAVQARYLAYAAVKETDLERVRNAAPYPIHNDGFARSFDPLTEERDFWNCWSTYGLIVGKAVVSKESCQKTISRIHQLCDKLSNGTFSIEDPNTHERMPKDNAGTPLISRGFFEIYHDDSLAQLRQALRIYIHHVIIWGRTDLWTTYDRLGVKLAGHKESRGLPLHVDQNPTVQPGFETVQGVLALTECPIEQGTYMTVPSSLYAFSEYTKMVEQHERQDYKGEYLQLQQEQHPELGAVLEAKKQAIPLHAGDHVSWDSRTTHANTANVKGTARMVAYISAGPAPEENADAVKEREGCFLSGLGKNVRDAKLHASMKPRFTAPEAIAAVREPEKLNLLGKLLYGKEKYSKL